MTIPKLYLEEICVGACGRTKSKLDKSAIIRPHTAWLEIHVPESEVTTGNERGGGGKSAFGGGVGDDAVNARTWTFHLCMGESGCRHPFVILVCSIERDSCLQTFFARQAQTIRVNHDENLVLDAQALVQYRPWGFSESHCTGAAEDEFFCHRSPFQMIVPPPLLNSSFVVVLSPGDSADTRVWGEDGGKGLLAPFWIARIARVAGTERTGTPAIERRKERKEEEKTAGKEEAWVEHDEKRGRMFVISKEVYFMDQLHGPRPEKRRGVREQRRRRREDPITMDINHERKREDRRRHDKDPLSMDTGDPLSMDTGFRRNINHSNGIIGHANGIPDREDFIPLSLPLPTPPPAAPPSEESSRRHMRGHVRRHIRRYIRQHTRRTGRRNPSDPNDMYVAAGGGGVEIGWETGAEGGEKSGEECRWEFDSYVASAYESEWRMNIEEWHMDVCTATYSQKSFT